MPPRSCGAKRFLPNPWGSPHIWRFSAGATPPESLACAASSAAGVRSVWADFSMTSPPYCLTRNDPRVTAPDSARSPMAPMCQGNLGIQGPTRYRYVLA
jgi:hypothetical protein